MNENVEEFQKRRKSERKKKKAENNTNEDRSITFAISFHIEHLRPLVH
jgi:hypothetical protein